MKYSLSTPSDQTLIQRLMGMHDFYRTIPEFYGNLLNKQTIEKMREGNYAPDLEKMEMHETSYYTSLIIKLSESEGRLLFQSINKVYDEIIGLIKKYYPTTRTEAYFDSAHITIRSIKQYKAQSTKDLKRYKAILLPGVQKWCERFLTDAALYAKGLIISLNSFKGLSIGIKFYPNTPFIQTLRGVAGVALYDALDAGLLNPGDLWEEVHAVKWHTKLTHSTGLRVRDPAFLPPWRPASIPEREKAFIDEFEVLVERYENVVFGKISDIQLKDIYIRNGKSDKLSVGPEGGLEISIK